MSFVQRYGLWSREQKEAAARLARIVEEQKLEVIRFSFPDQHGILRGKTLVASEALRALESGCTITTTMFAKDTSHRTVFPVFTAGGAKPFMFLDAAHARSIQGPATMDGIGPTRGWETFWMEVDVKRRRSAPWAAPVPAEIADKVPHLRAIK